MKYETKIRILLHKKYFDVGNGFLNYLKYVIAFLGLASKDVWLTLYVAFVYAFVCYAVGRQLIKRKFLDADADLNNRFNPLFRKIKRKI